MDKLRALQYFVAAAQEGSFSGAARQADVSVAAVAKMVDALERELGARLLDRSTRGLRLTARGEVFRERCVDLLAQLASAERSVAGREVQERTLVVGTPALLSRAVLVPALPRFRQTHPHVNLVLRIVENLTVTDTQAQGLDVLIALGWPRVLDMVQRRLAQSRLVVCAHPDHWRRHGVPQRPADLARHPCVLVRSPEGTVLDLWRHERGGEVEEVAVRGWLTCERRDDAVQAVRSGHGVGRFADLSVWQDLREGALQPVLLDWDSRDSPPFNALTRAEARNDADTRAFVDFLAHLLGEIEAECSQAIGPRPSPQRPHWYARRQGRASGAAR